jgi:hypothetical protein
MERILQHETYATMQDNGSVISLKHKGVRKFLLKLIKEATAPYKTNLIHLGLDETWGLGRGKAFEINKPIDPRKMYLEHLQFLGKECQEMNLEPMMWGDIVVGHSHEAAMDGKQKKALPKNMEMVFWDYYADDPKVYDSRIKEFRKMGFEPLCSPGSWNWGTMWPSYQTTKRTMPVFTSVAKKLGVQRMLVTAWGDDGQEAPLNANWPSLAYFGEEAYVKVSKLANAQKRMQAICGIDFNVLADIDRIDYLPGKEKEGGRLSKSFLWEDPMLAKMSHRLGKKRLSPYYKKIADKIKKDSKGVPADFKDLLHYAWALSNFIFHKVDLFNETRSAYLKKDKKKLREILKSLTTITKALKTLHQARKKVWFKEFKPFGWEVIDGRFGWQTARLQTLKERLKAYCKGDIKQIEEFDETPLKEIKPKVGRFADLATYSFFTH